MPPQVERFQHKGGPKFNLLHQNVLHLFYMRWGGDTLFKQGAQLTNRILRNDPLTGAFGKTIIKIIIQKLYHKYKYIGFGEILSPIDFLFVQIRNIINCKSQVFRVLQHFWKAL